MGDVAMTVPVLRELAKSYPNLQLTMLSRGFLKPLFADIPQLSFFTADVYGKHKGVFGLFRLAKALKASNIDAVVDLHNVTRSKILCFYLKLLGVKSIKTIDKGRAEKKKLIKTPIKQAKQLKTTIARYATVLQQLGFNLDLSKPQFPAIKPLNKALLTLTGKKTKPWIGIAPFAQYDSKTYPLDLMEEVINVLAEKDYQLLLFGGGAKEVALLEVIAQKYKNTIAVAGQLKFRDELLLISHLDCMLAMDSANAHLAAMQGIPVVTLWGVTHPYAGFMPFNQSIDTAILPDLEKYPMLPCSIYGNKTCKDYQGAMRSITPETVVEKIILLTK